MFLSPRKRVLIAAVLLVEVVLIVAGVYYRHRTNEYLTLTSGLTEDFGETAVLEIHLDKPSFPTSFTSMECLGFLTASTGKVSDYKMKDSNTGEVVALASVLETVARDRDNPTKPKVLSLVVQLVSISSPERNVIPWVVRRAAELRSQEVPEDTPLTKEQLTQLFSKGTVWVFVPFLSLDKEETDQLVEYSSYIARYYGGFSYPKLENLVGEGADHHPTLGVASKPIPLLDIFQYFEN